MKNNFWYRVGSFFGLLLRATVYGVGVYGIVTSIWNREIPYLPVILLLTFSAWSKTLAIYEGVAIIIRNFQPRQPSQAQSDKIATLINFQNKYGGSPN